MSQTSAARAAEARAAGFAVRPMRPEDADAVGRVHVQVWREAYAGLMPPDFLAALDPIARARQWHERLAGPPGPAHNVVGTSPAGEVVAVATAGPARDDGAPAPWELWALNVLAAHHGTGLADLLMTELVGDRPALLWVLQGNERAIAFYRRHGFALDGATKLHPPTGATELRMVRGR